MKKIAFVFDGLGMGGVERVGLDYIRMCVDEGCSIDVFNMRPQANDLVKDLPEGVKYYPYNLSNNGCPETYSYGVHNWWWGKYAYAIISPILTLKQAVQKLFYPGKKYDVAISMAGHINDMSFVGKNYIKADKKICWCHGALISFLAICDAYAMLYKRFNTIVTLSSVDQGHIYYGKSFFHGINIAKIYNPTYILDRKLDNEKISSLKEKYGDYILYVARFDEGKGHDIAIKAMKALKEKGLDKKILFAGEGITLESMKQLAEKENVSANCVFLGNVYDIENYEAASHINMLTSSGEGLPTVIIEAMTFGKPCVMTNSDCGEVSANGRYCFLVDVDDFEAVADRLSKLYLDADVYNEYANKALERAAEFKPDNIKEKLFKVIF